MLVQFRCSKTIDEWIGVYWSTARVYQNYSSKSWLQAPKSNSCHRLSLTMAIQMFNNEDATHVTITYEGTVYAIQKHYMFLCLCKMKLIHLSEVTQIKASIVYKIIFQLSHLWFMTKDICFTLPPFSHFDNSDLSSNFFGNFGIKMKLICILHLNLYDFKLAVHVMSMQSLGSRACVLVHFLCARAYTLLSIMFTNDFDRSRNIQCHTKNMCLHHCQIEIPDCSEWPSQ